MSGRRPSADWVAEARAGHGGAGVYALYAGANAHAEGLAADANPFTAAGEAELAASWAFGWRTAEQAARDRANAAAAAEAAGRPDDAGQWWMQL